MGDLIWLQLVVLFMKLVEYVARLAILPECVEANAQTVLKDTVPLESTDISLRTYMGEELPVLGVPQLLSAMSRKQLFFH